MGPCVPAFLHLLSFVLTGSIIILLLLPINFKADNSFTQSGSNETIGSNSFVMTMRIDQLLNLITSIPTPRIDVAKEETLRYWNLPPTAQISDRMEAVGRCQIAAIRKWGATSAVSEVCNRIKADWLPVVLLIASINFISFFVTMDNTTGWQTSSGMVLKKKLERGVRAAIFSGLSWSIIFMLFMLPGMKSPLDIGMTYTLRGHIFSRNYYTTMPIIWEVAISLCAFVCVMKLVEMYCFMCANIKSNPLKNLEKKRWKRAEQSLRKKYPVTPKQVKEFIKFCKTEFPTSAGISIAESATTESILFASMIKKRESRKQIP